MMIQILVISSLFFCMRVLQAETDKPNIVLIYADDLGYGDLSCYGATKVHTPNIDRLAKEGRKFTDAHSPSAVCTPSRYGLLTGIYPHRKGLRGPAMLQEPLLIEPERPTIATLMKEQGYTTTIIGKWHLGFGNKKPTNWNQPLKPGPLEVGFDSFFGVPVVNSHPPFVYMQDHHVVDYDPKDPFVLNKQAKTQEIFEKMATNRIGGADKAHELYDDYKVGTTLRKKAIEFIQKNKERPFFLYLPTTNIHHPFTPAKQFIGSSQCGLYGDFIHELDWIVGGVIDTLDSLNLSQNTLVIFTSDNGGMLNIGGQEAWAKGHRLNGDLLGFKFGAWEGGHRIPFIAKWPGKIKPNTVSNSLICSMDLFSTFASMFKRPLKQNEGLDSVSLLPVFLGEGTEVVRETLLYSPSSPKHKSIRFKNWVYIPNKNEGGFTGAKRGGHAFGGAAAHTFTKHVNSDIQNGKIKPNAPNAQLYNLENDLSQTKNVIREYPEIAQKLSLQLKNILQNPTAPHLK